MNWLIFICLLFYSTAHASVRCEALFQNTTTKSDGHYFLPIIKDSMQQMFVTRTQGPEGALTNNSNFQLLLSYLQSYQITTSTAIKYLNLLTAKELLGLKKAIQLESSFVMTDLIKAGNALKSAKLYTEAFKMFYQSLQFYRAADILNNNLQQPEKAKDFLESVGLPIVSNKRIRDQVDHSGLLYLEGKQDSARDTLRMSFRNLNSSYEVNKVLQAYKSLRPIKNQSSSDLYYVSIASKNMFINSLTKDNTFKFVDRKFFVSLENSEFRGEKLDSRKNILGGPYHQGKSIYFVLKPENILKRDDYHISFKWDTYGEVTEKSIFSSDRRAVNQFIDNVSKQSMLNEIVFQNSSSNPLTLDALKEIWVHPLYRNKLLTELQSFSPPLGKSWSDIVKGVTTAP